MPTSNTCVKTGPHAVAMTALPYPDEPGPGQALVRTTLSTICGSDMHIVDEMPIPGGVPMGHEAIGIVEAVGAGVTAFKAGDRVATSCLPSAPSTEAVTCLLPAWFETTKAVTTPVTGVTPTGCVTSLPSPDTSTCTVRPAMGFPEASRTVMVMSTGSMPLA